jgi:DNA-3-methyladenine glycosylase II
MGKVTDHLRSRDAVLGGIIERVGPYRIRYREPDFATLVRSIVYQQLSGKVAQVIYERLEQAAGSITPARIAKLADEQLRGCGLSSQKVAYIRDLSERTLRREVVFRRLPSLTDEGVIEHLTQVKGVGVWTAHMFLIFALRRPNVLPVGDLGIRTAVRNAYGLAELPKPGEMELIGEPWRPYCSVASWYLWRSLENVAAL